MEKFGVPAPLCRSLINYVVYGTSPGGFLQAVLRNDLMEAVSRADAECLDSLFDLCAWLHCCAPSRCYGSEIKFHDWVSRRGTSGEEAATERKGKARGGGNSS